MVALFNLHAVIFDEHAVIVFLVAHINIDFLDDLVLIASVRASLLVTDKTLACTLTLFILWTSWLLPYIRPLSETVEMIHICSRIGCDRPVLS